MLWVSDRASEAMDSHEAPNGTLNIEHLLFRR